MTEKNQGVRGWVAQWYSHESDDSMIPLDIPIATQLFDETRLFICTSYPKGITRAWTVKLRGFLKPKSYNVDFEFGLIAAGRAKVRFLNRPHQSSSSQSFVDTPFSPTHICHVQLLVDGHLVIDNWTRQRRGGYFFGFGSAEERGVYHLRANQIHEICVEFCNVSAPVDGGEDSTVLDSTAGVRLGGAEVRNSNDLMNEAVEAAKEADFVIAVVGLNADFETEGHDRKTLALPGRTDELIRKVAEVNKNTIVVTQAGSAITMPWVDEVPSIVHAWYLGNMTGDAIAQVLLGEVNPAGRLSLTFPKRLEDVPSYASFALENGKVRYSEDLMVVGYPIRFHFGKATSAIYFFLMFYLSVGIQTLSQDRYQTSFRFRVRDFLNSLTRASNTPGNLSHGLSYTTFEYSDLKVSEATYPDGDIHITVTFTLTNSGSVAGSEAVQLYVTLPQAVGCTHPPLQLKAFKKVKDLKAGASVEVALDLDKYAVSYWDESCSTWNVDSGVYVVRVGGSSAKEALVLSGQFEVPKSFRWNGL